MNGRWQPNIVDLRRLLIARRSEWHSRVDAGATSDCTCSGNGGIHLGATLGAMCARCAAPRRLESEGDVMGRTKDAPDMSGWRGWCCLREVFARMKEGAVFCVRLKTCRL